MKHILPSLRMILFLSLILGFAYPLMMTGLSAVLFSDAATGSFIKNQNGQVIGSSLIGQKFEKPEYFWGRPSAIDYNPVPSGGSNLGPTSLALQKIYAERLAQLRATHPTEDGAPPQDLLFTSASGIDPHISPEAAFYQIERVATTRKMSIQDLQALVLQSTEGRQFGILGEPRVNVLKLNLAIDAIQKNQAKE